MEWAITEQERQLDAASSSRRGDWTFNLTNQSRLNLHCGWDVTSCAHQSTHLVAGKACVSMSGCLLLTNLEGFIEGLEGLIISFHGKVRVPSVEVDPT